MKCAMTIDEAIQRIVVIGETRMLELSLIDVCALLLGIEALKEIKECRASHMFCPGLKMPGETE